MDLGIGFQEILFFALGLVLLYFLGYIILSPFTLLMKFILSAFLGAAAVVVINLAGASFGVTIPVNPATALIVGFLGLPGVVLIFVLKLIFGI
jgi:inhibitor of the pro-sigma K processing machinery